MPTIQEIMPNPYFEQDSNMSFGARHSLGKLFAHDSPNVFSSDLWANNWFINDVAKFARFSQVNKWLMGQPNEKLIRQMKKRINKLPTA